LRRHGHTHRTGKVSPEYAAWQNAKSRCFNPGNTRDYPDYGGRGITMCHEWRDSFEAFLHDMGVRPSAKHSLDRRDTNGPYDKANCRWASLVEQANNTRANVLVTHDGRTDTIAGWAHRLGLKPSTLHQRLRRGWTVRAAMTVPPMNRHDSSPSQNITLINLDES
jgi:hypothetical protein